MKISPKAKLLALAITVTIAMIGLTGCGGSGDKQQTDPKASGASGTVTASGSTALLPLLKPAAEEFQKNNPNVTVTVTGGGSMTGQTQVASGNVNIGNSDVPIDAKLKEQGLKAYEVCVAPFVFIVHPSVKVDNVTQEQLVNIFSGKIKNWKEVGGDDQPITVIHRKASSGSRITIQQIVMKDAKFDESAVQQDSNGAVRSSIANTAGAIGYVDAPYADNTVKVVKYNGIAYSAENVINGTYPVFAKPIMITKGEPTGAVKAFIDYVLSAEFQNKHVEANKFIPINKIKK